MNPTTTTPAVFHATTGNTMRDAARVFWPDHADLIYDYFDEINARCFDNRVPIRGIVVGLTPHGGRLGDTYPSGRITLHPSLLTPSSDNPWNIPAASCNPALLADVLTHEMIHAYLFATDQSPEHNHAPWCGEVTRLSPLVLGRRIIAAPWKRARRPKSEGGELIYAPTVAGAIPRMDLATWPHSLRPTNHYLHTAQPWWEQPMFHTTTENNGNGDNA